jgi:hypothetical protein
MSRRKDKRLISPTPAPAPAPGPTVPTPKPGPTEPPKPNPTPTEPVPESGLYPGAGGASRDQAENRGLHQLP